jgi:hypothetical protein
MTARADPLALLAGCAEVRLGPYAGPDQVTQACNGGDLQAARRRNASCEPAMPVM